MPLRSRQPGFLAFIAVCLPAAAQTHRVAAPQTVTRAVGVYEWTGDLARPTAARLVPVSLFINGSLQDAGLYLARPVPFALQPGDVYSVELAGQEKGTLDLEHARDVAPPAAAGLGDVDPTWYGYGPFVPLAPPKPAPALHASAHPGAIVGSSDPSRPHLATKASASTASGTTTSTGTAPGASTKPESGKPGGTASSNSPAASSESRPASTPMGDDPDRPVLERKPASAEPATDSSGSKAGAGAQTGSGAPSSGGTSADSGSQSGGAKTDSPDTDPERPSLRRRSPGAETAGRKSPPHSGVTGPDRSLNDDPDRPVLHRGAAPGLETAEELQGMPAGLHQVAAVSDANHRDAHVFAREWDSAVEKGEVLSRMQALARVRAAAYLSQNKLTAGPLPPSAASAPSSAAAKVQASPSVALPAANQPASPSDGDAPVLRRTPGGVRTSTASVPASPETPAPTASSSASPTSQKQTPHATAALGQRSARAAPARHGKATTAATPELLLMDGQLAGYTLSFGGLPTFVYTAEVPLQGGSSGYVTLVAQRLPSGELQVALSSVTDAAHLDRTPWLRLIDAVDPDDSHRASLLFELRAHSGRQFALYQLASAKAEQQFVTGVLQ